MKKIILNHFKKNDSVLYRVALTYDRPFELKVSENLFSDLCEDILGQQLSVRVGDVISGRFFELFPEKKATPEFTLKFAVEDLRKIGTSRGKAAYILDLAQKIVNAEVHLESFIAMDDNDVMRELVKVKGIGPWTAEMFLMSSLAREDVFSAGDLGLKRAIEKLYKKENPSKEEMEAISIKWSPYRTYACKVLWHSLDNS
jgi:DNA-3-methyladenine glycosylase II